MTTPAPSRPTRSSRTRWGSALLAASLAIGLAVVGARTAQATPVTDQGWTTDLATVSVARRGETVTLTVTATSATDRSATVDLEIWNPDPARPGSWLRPVQRIWDAERFVADTPRTFVATWAVPADEPLNVHLAKIGVFAPNWSGLYHWNDAAGRFTVAEVPTNSTTPSTTVAPTTTTTATTPPTSTTTTPTTTTSPTTTTTGAPVTTTSAPSPPPPPVVVGSQFMATFETASDFFSRFDRYIMSGADAPISEDWTADHDMSCGAPPTERPIHGGAIHSGANPDHLFFWCAPGGDPAKGHIMSTVLTGGVVDLSFSPHQAFTDPHQVCWDVNTTWLSSRKWVNVLVVPAASVTNNGGRLDFLTANDMGLAANSGLLIDTQAPGAVRIKEFFGHVEAEVHTPGGHFAIYGTFLHDIDKATRYRHCLTENSGGTLTIQVDRPNANICGGPPQIYPCEDINATFPGQFPNGPVRVIFQDALYDAPKGEVLPELPGNFNTWHWDNISIS
jgi:hypothetical protein